MACFIHNVTQLFRYPALSYCLLPSARLRGQRSCGGTARLSARAAPADLCENSGRSFVVAVLVVPIPPLIRCCLRITFGRVFPFLLPSERGDVEIVPRSPHLFVAAIVDEVGAKHAVAIADERIRAVPLVHVEVLVEVIRDRITGDELPAHTRL